MLSNEKEVIVTILKDEGGYAERSTEGGGAVNMGITYTVFCAWRLMHGKPKPTFADLKAMDVAEATLIYRAQYLDGVHFNDLPAGVDYEVADASINGGVAGSIKILQEALGLEPDGHYGLVTRWAVQHRVNIDLINKLCNIRVAKYKTFKNFSVPYKEGEKRTWGDIWIERIERVRKRSIAMLSPQSQTQSAPAAPVAPKPPVVISPAVQAPAIVWGTVPPPPTHMPASNNLSKGMLKLGLTPPQFLEYLDNVASKEMKAWRPRGLVWHNTGAFEWPGKVKHSNGVVEQLTPYQRLDNMTVDWASRGFPSTPHALIAPDGIVWLLWPLWKAGTHAKSWNSTHWGIETKGDFDKEKPSRELVKSLLIVSAGLYSMIGQKPDEDHFHQHKEDPKGNHFHCPGINLGTKKENIQDILIEMENLNQHSH